MDEKQNPYKAPSATPTTAPAEVKWTELKLRENATNIFASGLFGIMAPAVAIYAIVFLLRNRQSFPRKRLAIIGTLLHCIWTPIWIYLILF